MKAKTIIMLFVLLGVISVFDVQIFIPVANANSGIPNDVDQIANTTAINYNYVRNGDFEDPIVRNITFDTYWQDQSFGAWTVESGSIDHISEHYWQAASGRQSVDLTGSNMGAIYQDLFLPIGDTYLLQFALAGNPEGAPSIKIVEIWWGSTLLDTLTFDVTGRTNWDMEWSYHHYVVTNFNAITRLSFRSQITGYFGPVIDQVSVYKIEESLPFLDLPFDYTNQKFATVALGNTGVDPGRVNSWFDHEYPTYDYEPNAGTDNITKWNGNTLEIDPNMTSVEFYLGKGIFWYDGHNGIDFSRSSAAEDLIYSAASGTVLNTTTNPLVTHCTEGAEKIRSCGNYYGNQVWIDHGNKYATLYSHLRSVSVTAGEEVTRTVLGVMGDTGNSYGTHLHFGLYYDEDDDGRWEVGEQVDPYGWFGTTYDPWVNISNYLWKYRLWDSEIGGYLPAILTAPSGRGRVTIPSGSLVADASLELWDVPLPQTEISFWRSLGHAIWLRISNIFTTDGVEIQAHALSQDVSEFDKDIDVNIRYRLDEMKHLDISQLTINFWDESTEEWVPLPTNVNYSLREASALTNKTGNFSLRAPLLCPDDGNEIDDDYSNAKVISTNGTWVNNIFDIVNDEDWLMFEGIAGKEYSIETNILGPGVVTIVELYDTDGQTLLASSNDTGDDQGLFVWGAPLDGFYFVRVIQGPGSTYGCDAVYQVGVRRTTYDLYFPMLKAVH
jgi:choice-of-anchor C domain-containing protein